MKKFKLLSAMSIAMSVIVSIGSFSLAGAVVNRQNENAAEYEKTFTAATYNVGGLPIVGSSDKAKSTLIAAEISKINIVNVQENFSFNKVIRKNLTSDVVSRTASISGKFVGMDTFSTFAIKDVGYEKWNDTNGGILKDGGADRYASKGVRYSTVILPDGSEIDVYNYHTDAGGNDTPEDPNLAARRSNLTQLAKIVNERSISKNRAVIVMGDSNSRYTRVNDDFKNLVVDACGLTDAWVEIVREGAYPEKNGESLTESGTDAVRQTTEIKGCEKVDKVLYRSGADLELYALSYADLQLQDENGDFLSDHNPIQVKFGYKALSEPGSVNNSIKISSAKISKIGSLFSSKKAVKIVTTADAASIVIKDAQNNEIQPVSVDNITDGNYTAKKWSVKLDKSLASGKYTVSAKDSLGRVSGSTVEIEL